MSQGTNSHHPEFYSAIQNDMELQQQTRPHLQVFRTRRRTLTILQGEILRDRKLCNRGGGATTASGTLGHLGVKTIGETQSSSQFMFSI